jgi:hypothetical protein
MSDAALTSIAELQQRIKFLEYDNYNLKQEYESLKAQLEVQGTEFGVRDSSLSSANSRAMELLRNSSELMAQITVSRKMNSTLKDQVAQSERILSKQRSKNQRLKREFTNMSQRLADITAQLSAHEAMIGEMCLPPKQHAIVPPGETLVLLAGDVPGDLFPPDLGLLHAKLKALPKIFHIQDLKTKKDIVYALATAKTSAQQLFSRIKFLEKRRYASSSPRQLESNARALARQQCIICNDMKQFSFASGHS